MHPTSGMPSSPARCAACGAGGLRPDHRVRRAPPGTALIPSTTDYGAALGDLVRCAACGHRQVDPMPDRAVLEGAYADATSHDYLAEEAGQRVTARTVLSRVEAHRPPGRLLDLGCWTGFLLDEAAARGWAVTGVEPSSFASAYARERLGLDVSSTGVTDAPLRDAAFDAVVMGDVIEHLPDPAGALERVHRALAPGGVVVLMLPDAGSAVARVLGRRWWSVIPTHVQYFTRASIERLLARTRFDVLDLDTQPKSFSVGYYLGRAAGYSGRVAGVLARAAAMAGVADRRVTPDFHDRMLVIARRREPVSTPPG